eukprot:2863301-Rhodomonas_salina.2
MRESPVPDIAQQSLCQYRTSHSSSLDQYRTSHSNTLYQYRTPYVNTGHLTGEAPTFSQRLRSEGQLLGFLSLSLPPSFLSSGFGGSEIPTTASAWCLPATRMSVPDTA